ncbi:alpha/beta fold hydrolase [Streptomyces sp. NPDC056254]|uniref:alpha/beta fold hydrolase n=1 Tax=Streptomyces sp. NPDC056254 TaxID=3345763 RepID=UPI0035DB1C90
MHQLTTEPLTMAILNTGDLSLHVQRLLPADGRPPVGTVVLLHGLFTDSLASYYFTLAPALAAVGFDVVMYDQRGHGRSDRPSNGYQLDAFVTDLDKLIGHLGISRPVHLIGNSYGGTVAFGYAVHRPEHTASLLVIESEPATSAWARKLHVLFPQIITQLCEDEARALAEITNHYDARTARLAKSASRLARETTILQDIPSSTVLVDAQIQSVRCPVLAVYGGDGDLVAQASKMRTLLPDCRTNIVPGHKHSVLIEAPKLLRELAMSWLHDVSKPGSLETEKL